MSATLVVVGTVTGLSNCAWLALWVTGRLRCSRCRYYFVSFLGDVVTAACCWGLTATGSGGPVAAFGGVWAWRAWLDYRHWRDSDDDDDWGRRVRSWARSHIPRPVVLRLRPGVGAA